jgi:predicted nucleotidyltransferase
MPAVSRKDAIQAALLLKTYTKQVNSSFARKMESMLAQFGHETRYEAQSLLCSSTLDSYFKKIE